MLWPMAAAPDRSSFDPAALERAFDVPARLVRDGVIPWGVLGVANRDGVIRLAAVSPPDGPRVGVNTVALIASITKPVIATLVMQLVAEGRLALTDPLERHLPEAASVATPERTPVTPWHLLTHTSGLVDLDLPGLMRRCETHEQAVRVLLEEPRRTAPGEAFAYTTGTFDLLGALASRLDGRSYPEALRARILEPLGMTDTTFDPRGMPAERVVLPLAAPLPAGGTIDPALLDAFIAFAMPGAGLWSTAPDLLRFGRAMLRGGELDGAEILPEPFVRLMTREVTVDGLGRTGDPVTDEHYALGWGMRGPGSPASASAFGHGGITGTRLWIDPEEDLVIAWLTGAWDQPLETADLVVNAVYAALRREGR